MPFDALNKIRYFDSLIAKWLMRHFYFMFFQIILVVIFLFWFVNLFNVIDTTQTLSKDNVLLERILKTQAVNSTIAVSLILLNSFWMLYIFNVIQRMHNFLKDISFSLSRIRHKFNKP